MTATTTAQIQDDHIQSITQSLNQAGHNVSSEEVKPASEHSIVPNVSDIINVGSQMISNEELQSGIKDLEYVVEADLKNGDKVRVTESKNPLKLFLNRLMRKKNQDEEVVEK